MLLAKTTGPGGFERVVVAAATSLGGNAGTMEGSPDYDCGIENSAKGGDSLDDPMVLPLGDDGGVTRTHAIDSTSAAPRDGLPTTSITRRALVAVGCLRAAPTRRASACACPRDA